MVGSYGLTFKLTPMPACTGGMLDGGFANPQHQKWNDEPEAQA
jgi:hypothetical protein